MRQGEVIAGRYRVLRCAGAGGMGTVYEAQDLTNIQGCPVAIKTLRTDLRPGSRRAARLVREAAALADIRDPAVVQYVDHGVLPGGSPFLVMEWVAGETLRDRLGGPSVTPAEALGIAGQIARGLAASHARGVVHRDLKPGNVMLRGGDLNRVVIVDYGVARLSSATELTTSDGNIGTPRYMAPEQIRNARAVDGRADVFALGCVLFECLTGRPAFDGDDAVGILARVLFEPLPSPRAVRSDLPEALDRLVAALLERDATRRPSATDALPLIEAARQALEATAPLPPATRPFRLGNAGATVAESSDSSELDEMPPSFAPGRNALAAQLGALPPGHGSFVGRKDECAHVAALLGSGSPVVVVWGAPGVGKTRLLLEAVTEVARGGRSPWDALIFGDLEGAEGAEDVVRVVSREAGMALEASSAPEVALARALGRLGRVLLVLDRADAVSTPLAAMLRAFARFSPSVQVVLTSRRRVRSPGATAVEIGPLSTTPAGNGPSPAAQLFLERARESLPSLAVTPEDPDPSIVERAERIARALDGIPLALELSAATAPLLGLDGLLSRLERDANARTSLEVVSVALQGPMLSALEQSWALLSAAEQRALAECSVFRGDFSVQAAEAVLSVPADAGAPGRTTILAVLQSLREHSLLHSVEASAAAPAERRLSMYGPVREFAAERLEATGAASDTLSRHAAHFASYDTGPFGVDRAHRLRVDRDAQDLLAAAEFSLVEGGSSLAVALRALSALEPAVLGRGSSESFGNLLDRALAAYGALPAADQEPSLDARVRQIRARLDAPSGRTARALSDLSLCLDVARAHGDSHREATVLLDLGVVHHLDGSLARARASYEAALRLLRPGADFVSEGRCVGNLGALSHDQGDLAGAARLYREAIDLFAEADEARHRGNLSSNLGVLEQELGRRDEARALYEQALALLEPLRDARLVAIALGNASVLELELDAPARALPLLERCRSLLSGSEDGRSRALCYGRLGAALSLLGRFEEAEARLLRAERIASNGDRGTLAAIALHRAILDLSRAERAHARDESGVAAKIAEIEATARRVARDSEAAGQSADDVRAALRILERRLTAIRAVVPDP